MMQNNPYQSPTANPSGSYGLQNAAEVSPDVLIPLVRTRPWLIFIGVISIILSLISLIGGVAVMATASNTYSSIPQFIYVGVFYLIIGVILMVVAIKLLKYSSAISRVRFNPVTEGLVDAVERQRSLWVAIGFTFIIMILMWIGMVVVFAMMATSSRGFYD